MCTIYRLYKCANALHQWKVPLLPKVIFYLMRFGFGAVVPYTALIGRNTVFQWDGLGIVIHHRAVIGMDCDIGQGVTIGGRSGYNNVPTLGDHIVVGAGAKILGPVRIGDYAVIGANRGCNSRCSGTRSGSRCSRSNQQTTTSRIHMPR